MPAIFADPLKKTGRFVSHRATASYFVPSAADFGSIAPGHRIPEAVLSVCPHYRELGFVVLVLPPGHGANVRPMGLFFRTRDPGRIWFPVYQCLDGAVSSSASFDLTLYCQHAELSGWEETAEAAQHFVDPQRCHGAVDPDRVVQRRVLFGLHDNRDVVVATS